MDLQTETPVRAKNVKHHVLGNPGPQTVHNWMTRGVRGVVLESARVGGAVYTTEEALERFLRATQR